MDWSTKANIFVAFSTFALACVSVWQGCLMRRGLDLSRKELSLLRTQTDLYAQERELAKRPNIFIDLSGSRFARRAFPGIAGERKEMLYFLLLNMSEFPIEYSTGFIYEWQPGKPIDIDPQQNTGRLTYLGVPFPPNKDTTLFVKPGERLVLVPYEETAVQQLFPERDEMETTFLVVLAVVYPRAPGGIAYVRVPVKISKIENGGMHSNLTYVGWSMYEFSNVSFPLAGGV